MKQVFCICTENVKNIVSEFGPESVQIIKVFSVFSRIKSLFCQNYVIYALIAGGIVSGRLPPRHKCAISCNYLQKFWATDVDIELFTTNVINKYFSTFRKNAPLWRFSKIQNKRDMPSTHKTSQIFWPDLSTKLQSSLIL